MNIPNVQNNIPSATQAYVTTQQRQVPQQTPQQVQPQTEAAVPARTQPAETNLATPEAQRLQANLRQLQIQRQIVPAVEQAPAQEPQAPVEPATQVEPAESAAQAEPSEPAEPVVPPPPAPEPNTTNGYTVTQTGQQDQNPLLNLFG